MAKIWCEKCAGTGRKIETMSLGEYIRGIGQARQYICHDCNGKGYTESPETQRLLEIGKATVEAFDYLDMVDLSGIYPASGVYVSFVSVNELLKWHKDTEAKG